MLIRRAQIAFLIVLLVAVPLLAAITYDTTSHAADTVPANLTFSMTNANVANRVTLLCGFTSDASTSTPVDTMSSAPTYGGTPGTLVGSVFTQTAIYNVSDECYRLVAPATGSNTASFTSYGSSSIYHSVHAITLDDVNQASPIRSSGANGVNDVSGSTAPTVTCSNAQSGDIVVSFFALFSSSGNYPSVTPAGSMTHRLTSTTQTGLQVYVYTQNATGSTTASLTLGSARDYRARCFAFAPTSSGNGFLSLLGF
jgi:hypothetical protein